jgi:hypothetical protein
MIIPAGLHAPPNPCAASHITTAGPPPRGIFFSLPRWKKAIIALSGDQNGQRAPSVPSSSRDSIVASECIQRA